ncbi:uncharacterized protein LOC135595461 [Musa acuminata AAA Group]|uniref:uncharacterized protein LOC135595461 n=1 Tax=Musa acuminata AAA Group TaxID=214697 RepID=UPI0031DA0E09
MKDAAAVGPRLSKKNSDDEERRKKKKKKMKSNKRRRLRHSSCSSSDSDDGSPRSRRKRAKRLEKRKREPKNDDRKKRKKKSKKKEKEKERSRKSRNRSVSASSGSSGRSCSTCRGRSSSSGSSVSRSPPPRAKQRARSRSRGRGRDGDAERGRGRRRRTTSFDRRGSRYRSRSCSTCGGSRSSGRTGGSACRSRSCSEEKYREIEQPRRQLRSILAMAEDREVVEGGFHGKDEQGDRIIQSYDDFDRYDGGRKSDTHQDSPQRNAKNDEALAKNGNAKDSEMVLSISGEQTIENADGGGDDFTRKKKDNSGGPEAVELESQLRQRALDNFAKFRRSLSANTRSTGCQEDDSSQPHCGKDPIKVAEAQDAFKSSDGKFAVSHECQGGVQGEVRRAEPRVRSVVNIPAEKDTSSHVIRRQSSSGSSRKENEQDPDNSNKGQSDPNQLNWIEEPSNKMSLQHSSLIKDRQEKSAAAEPESSTVCDAAVNQSVGQPTSALPADQRIESENENKDEDKGSQFQQKTFSRMHDGELVQVSYKVYIPKKSPALARRQPQR